MNQRKQKKITDDNMMDIPSLETVTQEQNEDEKSILSPELQTENGTIPEFYFFSVKDGSKIRFFGYDDDIDTWNSMEQRQLPLIISLKEDYKGERTAWVYPIKLEYMPSYVEIPFEIPIRETDTLEELTLRVNQKILELPYSQKTFARLKKMKLKNKSKMEHNEQQRRNLEDEEEEEEEEERDENKQQQSNILATEGYLKLAYLVPASLNCKFLEDINCTPAQIYSAASVVLAVQFADRSEHTAITYGPHRLRKRHLFGHRI